MRTCAKRKRQLIASTKSQEKKRVQIDKCKSKRQRSGQSVCCERREDAAAEWASSPELSVRALLFAGNDTFSSSRRRRSYCLDEVLREKAVLGAVANRQQRRILLQRFLKEDDAFEGGPDVSRTKLCNARLDGGVHTEDTYSDGDHAGNDSKHVGKDLGGRL
jgi:hypothetical protein